MLSGTQPCGGCCCCRCSRTTCPWRLAGLWSTKQAPTKHPLTARTVNQNSNNQSPAPCAQTAFLTPAISTTTTTTTTMRASLFSLLFAGASLAALPKITRTGKYLYDESGNRFFIKVLHPPSYYSTTCAHPVLILIIRRVSRTRRRARLVRPSTEASPSPSTLSCVPSFLPLSLLFAHSLPQDG